MSAAVAIIAWIGAVTAFASGWLLFRQVRALPAKGDGGGKGRVSVVIPARDEQANLAKLLPALARQGVPPHEVIVVDDQSSDGTAGVAREAGARVVTGRELPDGWFGKPWACQQGAEAATGEWLLFIDADVEPEPGFLQRMSELMADDVVVSVCPWHRIEKPYEELSAFFNLLMVGGIGAFTVRGDEARGIGLFGQTLLISRKLYDSIGGHGAVRRTVLENLHLARLLEERGVRRLCRIGQGTISMRMFPEGFGQLCRSWMKGFVSGAGLAAPGALVLSSIWLSGLMVVSVAALLMPLAEGLHRPVTGFAFLFGGLTLIPLFRRVGRFSWWSALAFPVSLFFYQALFFRALLRRRSGATIEWKGRDVA